MGIMVKVSSHWDARTSKLDGETYADEAAALADLQRFVVGELVTCDADGSSLVYDSQEACDADQDGSSAIARIDAAPALVTVETMPDHLRASHRAAGNWGRYPLNGAERVEVSPEEADDLIAEDNGEYNHVVRV